MIRVTRFDGGGLSLEAGDGVSGELVLRLVDVLFGGGAVAVVAPPDEPVPVVAPSEEAIRELINGFADVPESPCVECVEDAAPEDGEAQSAEARNAKKPQWLMDAVVRDFREGRSLEGIRGTSYRGPDGEQGQIRGTTLLRRLRDRARAAVPAPAAPAIEVRVPAAGKKLYSMCPGEMGRVRGEKLLELGLKPKNFCQGKAFKVVSADGDSYMAFLSADDFRRLMDGEAVELPYPRD